MGCGHPAVQQTRPWPSSLQWCGEINLTETLGSCGARTDAVPAVLNPSGIVAPSENLTKTLDPSSKSTDDFREFTLTLSTQALRTPLSVLTRGALRQRVLWCPVAPGGS